MDAHTEISRVAIVGTGLIGSSWAACFLAHGLDVVATDPAPGTEDKMRQYVQAAWAALTKIGLAPGASTSRLRFESDLKEAVADADLVQENAPEREPLKIKLFVDIDSILPPPAILASSTSGIPMSRIQSGCKHPERCVTGHPFNPPHLIPLVEVVSVADADAAVCMGPGLRWALMGPNLIYHLGGGPGGIRHFFEHFTGPMAAFWADLGSPELGPELVLRRGMPLDLRG